MPKPPLADEPQLTVYERAVRLLHEWPELEGATTEEPFLTRLRADPTLLMRAAGMTPDPWQEKVLRTEGKRVMMLCSRQSGKSQVTAALALGHALLNPGHLVMLVSRSERQSEELFLKIMRMYDAAGRPVAKANDRTSELDLANGSRIVPVPSNPDTLVGFTVDLLVIDEGAKVKDNVYYTMRPVLIRSRGKLVVLSTPFGKRGWFYDEWRGTGDKDWRRTMVTAEPVPGADSVCVHYTGEELAAEKLALGPRWYAQEYLCSFEDAVGQVFSNDDIDAAMAADVPLLFTRQDIGGLPGEDDIPLLFEDRPCS